MQVASIRTLSRKWSRVPHADLIVIDEAHHACSTTYRQLLEHFPDAVVIGATATPWRADKMGLADLFGGSVLAATPAELMDEGALVRCDSYAYDAPDLHQVRVTAGDYNQRDLGVACNTEVLVGAVVREYSATPAGAGPSSSRSTSSTPSTWWPSWCRRHHRRARRLQNAQGHQHARHGPLPFGDLMVLSSVGVLTEGFDAPAAEVCILARPTKSLSLHLQMSAVFSAPRPRPASSARSSTTMPGTYFVTASSTTSATIRSMPRPSVSDLQTCPFCKFLFSALRDGRFCPACGEHLAEPEPQLEQRQRHAKRHIEGRRLDAAQIRAIRVSRERAGLRDLTDAELERAQTASLYERAAEYLRLCLLADERGFKPRFVAMAYRDTFGEFPKFTAEELTGVRPASFPFVKWRGRAKEAA